jgi:hypothetical protein
MATMVTNLVKRKCNVQGQEGDYALVRKNVKQTLVRAINPETGELGAEEQVDTALVTNERKYEAPKAPKEDKEYAADRPERKVCLVKEHGNTRFHLLRQGAEFSKVLEVGTSGTGKWIPNSQIADKFMVPSTNRPRYIPRQPIRVCQIEGRDGKYLLLRQTTKGARVIGPIIGENYGETVDASLIKDEEKIMLKRPKKQGDAGDGASADGSTSPATDSTSPATETAPAAPVQQPVATQPVQPAATQPVQPAAAPVQQPAAVQPRPAQPVHQPAAVQPRPGQPVQQPGARPQQVPVRPAPARS